MKTKTNKKVKLQGDLPKNVPMLKELATITRKLTQFCRDNKVGLFLTAEIKYRGKGYGIHAIDGDKENIPRMVAQNLETEPALKWHTMRYIMGRPLEVRTYNSLKEYQDRNKGKKK